ncbi:MAG: GNAT family N-acetyltransferase [Bacteroidales bacterium]|nr:GNAT family N-acetyltransferase [Bacteroidales bacterium]
MSNYSVFLRAFEPDDYLLTHKWRNDPEIQRLIAGHRRYVSSEMEKEWVRSKMLNNSTDIYWAICRNDEEKKMIGYISVNNIDHWTRMASAGGIVIGDRSEQNTFAAIEASVLILKYAFEELNMHKVYASCLKDHKSVVALTLGIGYKYEGTLRDNKFKAGRYHDEETFSMLEDEYFVAKAEGRLEVRAIMKRVVELRKGMKKM